MVYPPYFGCSLAKFLHANGLASCWYPEARAACFADWQVLFFPLYKIQCGDVLAAKAGEDKAKSDTANIAAFMFYSPFIMICLDYSGGGVDLATCLRQHQLRPTARYAVIRFSRGALMGH